MNYYSDFAEQINKALLRLDRSPSWLAQRIGVNPSTVSRWLNQGMRPGDPETVVRIADVLGVAAQVQTLLAAAGYGYIERGELSTPAGDSSGDLNHSPRLMTEALAISPPILHLPPQSTPFIGREEDVATVLNLLAQPGCRLVTITGVGGIGKTRLGIAVAAAAASRFADGVCFVPLATTETPQAMPRTIAAELDLPDVGAVDARQLLSSTLRKKNLLLVLDNLEHLVEGADFLADLVQQAPNITLLVTSQERLNLVEEWIYPLKGLSYPPAESPNSDEDYGAVNFFVACARKSYPSFDLEAERSHVVSICRLVEGMPLGIELAAGWVRAMSCQEIATELAQNIEFLTTPLRNLPVRHRSLRAVFERSWNLLTPEEQSVLCQLSVFHSGFDRQAAETVAGATPVLLSSLIDRSLIRRQPTGRFDMHGLLHRFVAEKLAEVPQVQADVRTGHAEYYANLAEHGGWELEPGTTAAKETLQTEALNLLAAWRWATETRNAAVIRRMIKPLANHYDYVGWSEEIRLTFDAAVQAFRLEALNPETVGLLGSLLLRIGKSYVPSRVQERYTILGEAVELLEQTSPIDVLDLALAYVEFGIAHASLGNNRTATSFIPKALTLFQSVGSILGEGHALLRLALVKLGWGQPREAAEYFEASARLFETRDEDAFARSIHILGCTLTMRGHYQRAEVLLQQALTVTMPKRRNLRTAAIMVQLAELKTFTGDFSEAANYYQQAYFYFDLLNLRNEVILGSQASPGVLARLRGDPDAEQQLVNAVDIARQVGFQQRLVSALYHLSRLRHDQRDFQEALALLDEALAIARCIDYRYAIALVLVQQGHSLLSLNQTEKARRCYAEALQTAGDEGIDRVALDGLYGVAVLLAQEGNDERAISLLQLARAHPASEYETRRRAGDALGRMGHDAASAGAEGYTGDHALELSEAIQLALQWLYS